METKKKQKKPAKEFPLNSSWKVNGYFFGILSLTFSIVYMNIANSVLYKLCEKRGNTTTQLEVFWLYKISIIESCILFDIISSFILFLGISKSKELYFVPWLMTKAFLLEALLLSWITKTDLDILRQERYVIPPLIIALSQITFLAICIIAWGIIWKTFKKHSIEREIEPVVLEITEIVEKKPIKDTLQLDLLETTKFIEEGLIYEDFSPSPRQTMLFIDTENRGFVSIAYD